MQSIRAVLVFAVWSLMSFGVAADTECTSDFYSRKTCSAFDDKTLSQSLSSQMRGDETRVDGIVFWLGSAGLVGDEVWHRGPYHDDQGLGRGLDNREVGNQAIHGFRCSTDLFGNISCDWISRIPD